MPLFNVFKYEDTKYRTYVYIRMNLKGYVQPQNLVKYAAQYSMCFKYHLHILDTVNF